MFLIKLKNKVKKHIRRLYIILNLFLKARKMVCEKVYLSIKIY